jgi:hypothetical protein
MQKALLPPPTLPLVYFGLAHAAFAAAGGVLVVRPDLPGAFHYQPQLIALVHLVTVGWISGSILGALYIVAPLAFGVGLRPGWLDYAACAAFWLGTAGMVAGFWTLRFDLVAAASPLVLAAIAVVGGRVIAGLWTSRLPWGVSLHVTLAFANILVAGVVGLLTAMNRDTASLLWSPLALALAHGHLAVLGWAAMMFFGVAYRLMPMFIPSAMPTGARLALSAVLLEIGTLGLAVSLALGAPTAIWVVFVVGAFVAFSRQVRGMLANRRPRPVELPRPDWSTWQTHTALLYLVIATALGVWLALGSAPVSVTWAYGAAAVLGFVSQVVVGIQGRLLPLAAWYRALEFAEGTPPPTSVHRLADPRVARLVFMLWLAGLPLLTVGLMRQSSAGIATGAVVLFMATLANAAHGWIMVWRSATGASHDGRSGSSE